MWAEPGSTRRPATANAHSLVAQAGLRATGAGPLQRKAYEVEAGCRNKQPFLAHCYQRIAVGIWHPPTMCELRQRDSYLER